MATFQHKLIYKTEHQVWFGPMGYSLPQFVVVRRRLAVSATSNPKQRVILESRGNPNVSLES